MRITRTWLLAAMAIAAIACSDDDDNNPTDGGTDGGGGGGGGTAAPAPTTVAVTVGDIFFMSDRNGTSNPAVDTVAVNGTVTWTWAATEALPHSVQSMGSPGFTSSAVMTGPGNTHAFTFTVAGTYQYDCAVHGPQMTGTIVVQ